MDSITTNIPPLGLDDIAVEDMAAFVHAVRRPDKAEIKVGDMGAFRLWFERHFGPTVESKPGETFPPSLMGVLVTVSHLLPPQRAALFVNDELVNIINLDDQPLRKGET